MCINERHVRLQSILIHQHNKSNAEWQLVSFSLTTQPSLTMNYYLINLHAMTSTVQLLKLPCFSTVSLYTQLPLVLHPNNSNISINPIIKHFPMHMPSIFHYYNLSMQPCLLSVICNANSSVWSLNVLFQLNSILLSLVSLKGN